METCDVLIVEDDADIRNLLVEELRQDGLRVALAHNGQQALSILANLRPRLLLLDLMMPLVSGWQVLDRLRADPDTLSLPVLVMTANGQDGPLGEVLLHKPFPLDELLRRVHAMLQRPEADPSSASGSLATPGA